MNRHTAVVEALNETYAAEEAHGRLTGDHFRAMAILMEEVGEVARALLELRRLKANKGCKATDGELKAASWKAVEELKQVMSTAALMTENLTEDFCDGK